MCRDRISVLIFKQFSCCCGIAVVIKVCCCISVVVIKVWCCRYQGVLQYKHEYYYSGINPVEFRVSCCCVSVDDTEISLLVLNFCCCKKKIKQRQQY